MAQTPADDDRLDTRSPTSAGPAEYHSYLLRLWCGGADGVWHGSLQSTRTGERHMFADLESLLAFLRDQVRPRSE